MTDTERKDFLGLVNGNPVGYRVGTFVYNGISYNCITLRPNPAYVYVREKGQWRIFYRVALHADFEEISVDEAARQYCDGIHKSGYGKDGEDLKLRMNRT